MEVLGVQVMILYGELDFFCGKYLEEIEWVFIFFFFFCIGVEFGFDVGEMVKVEFFIDFCWLRDWRVYR